jgi:hypothetical protein
MDTSKITLKDLKFSIEIEELNIEPQNEVIERLICASCKNAGARGAANDSDEMPGMPDLDDLFGGIAGMVRVDLDEDGNPQIHGDVPDFLRPLIEKIAAIAAKRHAEVEDDGKDETEAPKGEDTAANNGEN